MQQRYSNASVLQPLKAARPIWDNWYQISLLDMPTPYIHHVYSQPQQVSETVWKRWYSEERSLDMVRYKISSTAAFYEALSETLTYLDFAGDVVDEMKFLAIYQMDRTRPEQMQEYQNFVRTKSYLWDESKTCLEVAKFESDHLELIEILGSYEYSEGRWKSPLKLDNSYTDHCEQLLHPLSSILESKGLKSNRNYNSSTLMQHRNSTAIDDRCSIDP